MKKIILLLLPAILLCLNVVPASSMDKKQRTGEPWEKYWTDGKYAKWQYTPPENLSDSVSYVLGVWLAREYEDMVSKYDLEKLLDDFSYSAFKRGCVAAEKELTPYEDIVNLMIMIESGVAWEGTVSGEGIRERPLLSKPVRKLKTAGEKFAFVCGYSGAVIMKEVEKFGVGLRPKMMFYGAFAQLIPIEWNMMIVPTEEDLEDLSTYVGKMLSGYDEEKVEHEEDGDVLSEDIILSENALQEGVTVLPSGLQYKVLREGDGHVPGPEDEVGLRQATVLFSDYHEYDEGKMDLEYDYDNISNYIDGYAEGLQLMSVGAHYVFWVPTELCNGKDGRVIEVEMAEIDRREANEDEVSYLARVALEPEVSVTSSGLLYKEVRPGNGVHPRPGDQVAIKESTVLLEDMNGGIYAGIEAGDYSFDSGYVSDYIQGVSEALQLMSVGSHYIFWISSELCGEGRDGRYIDVVLLDIIPGEGESL